MSGDRWGTTLHLGWIGDRLVHAAIHEGTVTEVAEAVMARHAPDAQRAGRTYPIGEYDWPVLLRFTATVTLDDGYSADWTHEFRRPDEPWSTTRPAGDDPREDDA